jgi:transcriptional regulator with XRE-family HTH domain
MALLMVEPMPFKDRLRKLRDAAGLTQQQLAVAAGLTISAVAQMEAGKIKDPRISTLKALAKALGVGLLALAENGDEEEPAAAEKAEQTPPEAPKPRGRKKKGE